MPRYKASRKSIPWESQFNVLVFAIGILGQHGFRCMKTIRFLRNHACLEPVRSAYPIVMNNGGIRGRLFNKFQRPTKDGKISGYAEHREGKQTDQQWTDSLLLANELERELLLAGIRPKMTDGPGYVAPLASQSKAMTEAGKTLGTKVNNGKPIHI